MDLPPFYHSDQPVPPTKTSQRIGLYNLNKRTNFPVVKDAVLGSILDLSSLSLKYSLSAANDKGQVLRPLSTCLPFGAPNRVANLQDLCSGTLPFAVQAQQWLRDAAGKRAVGRPSTKQKGKTTGRGKSVHEDSDEVDEEDAETAPSETTKNRNAVALTDDVDSDGETETHYDTDPLLPFGNSPSIPDYRSFKPYTRDRDTIEAQGKRATIHAGFKRLPPLNSPLNWWYSGGCLSHTASAPDGGFFFHPSGPLTRVSATPFTLTDRPSFQRIAVAERSFIEAVAMKSPVYQIESQFLEGDTAALPFVRLSDEIVVLRLDTAEDDAQFSTVNIFAAPEADYFTHLTPSPYVQGEFLSATHKGDIKLQTVLQQNALRKFSVSDFEFKKSAKYGWTGCYFGTHPRDLCVATPCAVEVFDGRMKTHNTKSQMRLLAKGGGAGCVGNDIVAACLFKGREAYHVMSTTKETVIVDGRFAKTPLLRYPSQTTTAPLFIHSLSDAVTGMDVLLCGSQMSQQVMCFELDLGGSEGASMGARVGARVATVPFLAATPRQLIPQAVGAELQLQFTMKQRLEKPIIGVEGILQPGAGFTVAVLSALGDIFLQPFETVNTDTYEGDGTASFSTVHSDVRLNKKEKRHLKEWLVEGDREVMDVTMRDYVRPFVPRQNCRIGDEMSELAALCSAAVGRKAHALCRRCNPSSDLEEGLDLPDETCPRCKSSIKSSRVRRSTGENRFCYVEENNSTSPIRLPPSLQREDRLKEMAETNRIVWKILTKCYGMDIPGVNLLPETRDMPPPLEKKRARKSAAVRQEEMMQSLLKGTDDADGVPTYVPMYVPTDVPVRSQEEVVASPPRMGEPQPEPLATSTQKEQGYDGSQAVDYEGGQTVPVATPRRTAKKPKRVAGF